MKLGIIKAREISPPCSELTSRSTPRTRRAISNDMNWHVLFSARHMYWPTSHPKVPKKNYHLKWLIHAKHTCSHVITVRFFFLFHDSRIRVSSGIHAAVLRLPRKLNPWQTRIQQSLLVRQGDLCQWHITFQFPAETINSERASEIEAYM